MHIYQESAVVQTLRQEIADSRKKLQEYADTIVSLHSELRALRGSICQSCKRKFAPVSLQATKPVVDCSSLIKSSQRPVKHTNSTSSCHRLLKGHASDIPSSSGPSISESYSTPISNIYRTSMTPSDASTSITVPRWYARRDAGANAILNVKFVDAFAHKDVVRSVRFSADGKYLATVSTGDDKNSVIYIYNVESGDKTCELAEYSSQYPSIKTHGIYCMCFSPDGRHLVVGDTLGRVTVWDIPNKRIRNIFRGHILRVESVNFSPDGRLVVSASWDGSVRIWNLRDGSAKVFMDIDDALLSSFVSFSPTGQFIAVGTDMTDMIMKKWDARTSQLVTHLRWTGHIGSIWSVAFSPDGRGLVSGSSDGVVKWWDGIIRSSIEPVAVKILKSESSVNAVAVSSDTQWIASGLSDNNSVISDAYSAMRQCTLIGHTGPIVSVDFSPIGGYLAMGSCDCHVTLWRYTMNGSKWKS